MTGKTSVDRTHQTISANEECRGPSIQVFGLWNLLVQLAWFSSDEVSVFDAHRKVLRTTTTERQRNVRMLENTVELVGGLCLIALPLLISFCIVGSIVAALRAVSSGAVR